MQVRAISHAWYPRLRRMSCRRIGCRKRSEFLSSVEKGTAVAVMCSAGVDLEFMSMVSFSAPSMMASSNSIAAKI